MDIVEGKREHKFCFEIWKRNKEEKKNKNEIEFNKKITREKQKINEKKVPTKDGLACTEKSWKMKRTYKFSWKSNIKFKCCGNRQHREFSKFR